MIPNLTLLLICVLKEIIRFSLLPLLFLTSVSLYSQVTWYSYQSGPWNDTEWRTWTTDPSGTTLINPGSALPAALDDIVILNGRVVIIPTGTSGRTVNSVTIQDGAILDITNTTGHSLNQLNGQGIFRFSATELNVPAIGGGFFQSGGGTVEFSGTGTPTFQTYMFNNLIITLVNPSDIITYNHATPLTINGTFTVNKGVFRISDDVNTTARTLNFNGDVAVNENGAIAVGKVNIGATNTPSGRSHQIFIKGNLVNNGGNIAFTNLTAPVYTGNPPGAEQAGWSDVIFNNTLALQQVMCNGPVKFYRIQVEKGSDDTYILDILASDPTNFMLYGRNDLVGYSDEDINNLNAFGLKSGTCRLTQQINLPCLARGTYQIPVNARLWIDGANVTFADAAGVNNWGLYMYGKLTLTQGGNLTVGLNAYRGIVMREAAVLETDNSTLTTAVLRTSSIVGTPNRGTFRVKGTSVITITGNNNYNRYASLSFGYPENVIDISGGTIHVLRPTSIGGESGHLFSVHFGPSPDNSRITGGEISVTIPDISNAYINSTVPFYNLNILSENPARDLRVMQHNQSGTGSNPPTLTPQPIRVLNNFTLKANSHFNNTTNVDVVVGGDYIIEANATYSPGNQNTTTFNGSKPQLFSIQGTITNNLNHLTLRQKTQLTLTNQDIAIPVVVNGNLTVEEECTLIDNGRILQVKGNIYHSGMHFKPVTGAGSLQLTGTGAQIIGGTGMGIFNNLSLNKPSGSVALEANITIAGNLRLANTAARLEAGKHLITFTETANVFDELTGNGKNFNNNRMIATNGLMADGGIRKHFSNTMPFLFPFGFFNQSNTTWFYMPATIQFVNAPATFGQVTSRPVNGMHPLAQTGNALVCFWKTESNGFIGLNPGDISMDYVYDAALSNYFVKGNEIEYIPSVYQNGLNWVTLIDPLLVDDASNTITFNSLQLIDGEYTAGTPAAFASVEVLFSSGLSSDWNNPNAWSSSAVGGPGGGGVPDSGTYVIVGDETHAHTITINQHDKACGKIFLHLNSTLDLGITTGHHFGLVSGNGTLKIASSTYFPGGFFGNFLSQNGGTVNYYTNLSDIALPAASDITAIALDRYFNLILTPTLNTSITLPPTNLKITGQLTINGEGEVFTNDSGSREIVMVNDFAILSGTFECQNTHAQHLVVLGNLINQGVFTVQNSTPVNHLLALYGNLEGNGTFMAANGSGSILVSFLGTNNSTITGNPKAFHSFTVDKGSSQAPILSVLTGITTSFDPAVTLLNGTLRIKTGILNLSTTSAFTLAETACLSVDSIAEVTIASGNNDLGLLLAGKLELLSGTLNIGNSINNRRNSIEYSALGNPRIVISGGTLNINGQIRRNNLIVEGALTYIQTGGIVNIQGKNQIANRGKFEVCNPGSLFDLSGGALNFIRGGGTSFGDLYLRPESFNVTGGSINFSPVTAIGNQSYTIDAAAPLFHLQVAGIAGNSATAGIRVNNLAVKGDLTVNNFATLQCNDLDLSLAGDFNFAGTFVPGIGKTRFHGQNLQTAQLNNNISFYTLEVEKPIGQTLLFTTSGAFSPEIGHLLEIKSGTLTNSGTLNIIAKGNVVNNGEHNSTGSGSLLLAGSVPQLIEGLGNGQFGNLNINNGTDNGVTLATNVQINGMLTLTTGYLYTDEYLLTLGSGASIAGSPGNPANRNWITTNGRLSDAGIKKQFPTASPSSFTFPVGTAGKYTPATLQVTYNPTNPGSITVKPVNEKVPSVTSSLMTELQYYWNVTSEPFSSISSVSHSYHYIQSDVAGNEPDYVGARFHQLVWETFGTASVNEATNTISIIGNFIDGDYTCGEPANFILKPVYYTRNEAPNINTTGSSYTNPASWSTTGHEGAAVTEAPDGNPVVIASGHRLNVEADDQYTYSAQINGTLYLNATVGHNLGHVSGNGRIIITNTGANQFVFPGGAFDLFMDTPGSVVEFNGFASPESHLLPVVKTYPNLELTGPGSKQMANVDWLVKGDIRIRESALYNNLYNRDIILLGDWDNVVTNGFIAGTGLVALEGTPQQVVKTANPDYFYNFRINNPSGAVLNGGLNITNHLFLQNGNILTTPTDLLTISNSSAGAIIGGGVGSFVDGPLKKLILSGQSFVFPIGNLRSGATKPSRYGELKIADASGTDYWTASYVNNNPEPTYNRLSLLFPVSRVSDNEYWSIDRPGAHTAIIGIRWDDASGFANLDNIKLVAWATPENRWEEKNSFASGSSISGAVTTLAPVTTNDYVFTLGESGVTASFQHTTPVSICKIGQTASLPVNMTGTPNWTLTYTDGTHTFVQEGITTPVYTIQLTGDDLGGSDNYLIRLVSVTDGNNTIGICDTTPVPVEVLEAFEPLISGPFKVGKDETRIFSTPTHAGNSYLWEWSGPVGGTITSPAANETEVVFGDQTGSYQLKITETTAGCSASDIKTIQVFDNPLPVISPYVTAICQGAEIIYSTSLNGGNEYLWSVENGSCSGCGEYSPIGNSITVTWGSPGTGKIKVKERITASGEPGTYGEDSVTVIISPLPDKTLTIEAPDSVCFDEDVTITLLTAQSGFNYQLQANEVNLGLPQTGTGSDLEFQVTGVSKSALYAIVAYNDGCSEPLNQTVTMVVDSLMPNPGNITGSASICLGLVSESYSIPVIQNATFYHWEYSGSGATIDGSSNVVTIEFSENATNGSITVAGVNACGTSLPSPEFSMSILPLPETSPLSGNSEPACGATNLPYSISLTEGSWYAWTVSNGYSIVSDTSGIGKNAILVNPGKVTGAVTVVETNSVGCKGAMQLLTINPVGCVSIDRIYTSRSGDICVGDTVTIGAYFNVTTPDVTLIWDFGPYAVIHSTPGLGMHVVRYDSAGLKTLRLIASTAFFADTLEVVNLFSVYPLPKIQLGNDTTLCNDRTITLSKPGYATYEWSTGENSFSETIYPGAKTVWLTVTDEKGCKGTGSISILDCNALELLGEVTNAFTPNNDGIHDTWVINNITQFPDASIEVYDRWGRLVFRKDGGYANDWNGLWNGKELPMETYYYIIDLKQSGLKPLKGTVSIIR